MKLHIFDVKQFMYVGQSKREVVSAGVIQDGNGYRANEISVGSIVYLFDVVNNLKQNPDNVVVFCCDSKPTNKYDLCMRVFNQPYKGGRQKTPANVVYQFRFAEILLRQLNFNVFKEPGVEADDLISSLVHKYKNVFDKVIIYTNDSDQYYLVADNVMCKAVSNNCRDVDMSNYVSATSKKRNTQYNRVMLDKMLWGETGDNVPAMGYKYIKLAEKCIPDNISKYLGDERLLRTVVKLLVQDDVQAMAICDLILPELILDERVTIGVDKLPNWSLFSYYCAAFGCYAYRGVDVMDNEEGEVTIMEMINEVNNGR